MSGREHGIKKVTAAHFWTGLFTWPSRKHRIQLLLFECITLLTSWHFLCKTVLRILMFSRCMQIQLSRCRSELTVVPASCFSFLKTFWLSELYSKKFGGFWVVSCVESSAVVLLWILKHSVSWISACVALWFRGMALQKRVLPARLPMVRYSILRKYKEFDSAFSL